MFDIHQMHKSSLLALALEQERKSKIRVKLGGDRSSILLASLVPNDDDPSVRSESMQVR